jgi:hypothetical protein
MRFVSPCTALSALGIHSVRYVHDFRAMRFRLAFRLAIYVTSGLAFDLSCSIQDFPFMRFRPVRLHNGMEFVEFIAPFAPVFSACSRSSRLRFPDELCQLYTMILMFTSVTFRFEIFASLFQNDNPLFETFVPFSRNRHS